MQAPARPTDERERLEALQRYEILDTPPEQALDDLTALAAHICESPISLISLVDEHRQWFKSNVGMPVSETERDISFCGHAILQRDLFVVPDTACDARFADSPLVTEDPNIRFYAGAPLVTVDGRALGALCVMDSVPRDLKPSQREALRILSRQVMAQLEMRRHTRELMDSEGRLLSVFRNCPVAIAITRWSDKTYVDVNDAFTQLLGWTRNEVAGRTSEEMQMVEASPIERVRGHLGAAGVLRDYEMTVRTRSGEPRDVLIGTQFLDLRGQRHAVTTLFDVTARKQAEAAANKLAAIVQSSDDAIIGKDLNGIVTSWNKGAEQVFGYTAAEMTGQPIMRLIPADRRDEELQILSNIRLGVGVEHLETQRLTKDGRLIDVSLTTSPIRDTDGAVIGVSKVARDVTERKRTEQARRESEARYRALFEYAPDGIVIATPESYYLDANASMCRMLGYTLEEFVGLHASDILSSEEVPHIRTALRTIKSGADFHREFIFRRKDGTTFQAEVMATTMPDGNLLGMIRDSTERSRSEARFRRLVDSNAQGVIFWNAAGEITQANDAFLSMVGYSREDLESGGVAWQAMTPPEYAALDRIGLDQLAVHGVCVPFEKEYLRKDGSRVPVMLGAASFEDNPQEGVCFVLDLTERKKLEQQFLRIERMESIGTLAGGIAHDLNNVLAPILMAVDLLKEDVTNPEFLEHLDTLEGSARRGAALVQQVLTFARGVEGRHTIVNPQQVMTDLLKVMRDTFPKSITVRFAPTPGLWTVSADSIQLQQVFLNLCVNARDAMANGGSLTITMQNIVLDETYSSMNIDARPGAYVVVTVADTGTGIPPDVREKIFEPFFTTKEIGKGTGLGLSTTMAIIKSHRGFIHVYSEVGSGTKFKIYLPANTTDTAADQVAIDQTKLPRGDGELILVVDDEEAIRTIAQAALERFGYRVMLASNGAEAVAMYAQHSLKIALVLTDMAMPVMDGPATIVALKSINPRARIIASSGLAANGGVAKAIGAGVRHFVPKPYTAEKLLRTIREALDEDVSETSRG